MVKPRLAGIIAILAAAVLWGTTGTLQSLLSEDRDPLAVGALRLLFGAGSLVFLAACSPTCRQAIGKLPLMQIAFSGIAIGSYNLLFFWAVTKAGVGVGTAVTIGSAPLWLTAYEILVQRRRPNRIRAMGLCISLIGVGMLGSTGVRGDGFTIGLMLATSAGACYAAYSLTISRIGHRAPSTLIAASTFCAAALFTCPILFVVSLDWVSWPLDWTFLVILGVGSTGISYALYTWGLKYVAASTAVTLALAEPVTAWLLAIVIVKEPVTFQSCLSVVLILVGLAFVTTFPNSEYEKSVKG